MIIMSAHGPADIIKIFAAMGFVPVAGSGLLFAGDALQFRPPVDGMYEFNYYFTGISKDLFKHTVWLNEEFGKQEKYKPYYKIKGTEELRSLAIAIYGVIEKRQEERIRRNP